MFDSLFSQFHFMRPELLILLVFVPAIAWLMRREGGYHSGWSKYFNFRFLSKLQSQEVGHRTKKPNVIWLGMIFSLLVLAASGPAWEQKPQPVMQRADNLIVMLDLSISMLAKDTPPSRLIRAKQKIQDLLQLRNSGYTALIAYSGDSHVVTPLTDDTRTIVSNLSALEPFMMPVIGSRPDLAINQSLELIKGAQAGAVRLLLVTDDIAEHHVSRINDSLAKHQGRSIQLDILSIGTNEGGPIEIPGRGYLKDDAGNVVIAKTNDALLAELAQKHSGRMTQMSLDDSDLDFLSLLDHSSTSDINQTAKDPQEPSQESLRLYDQWEDAGYIFLIAAMILILISQRQFMAVVVLFVSLPQESQAFEWADLWSTPDQQGAKLFQQEQYEEAADRFESPHHKGDAFYRAGDYEAAAKAYEKSASSDALFNKANSLAKAGQLEEALKAYQSLLEKSPQHEDALFNKKIVEKLLQEQEQSQSNQQGDSDQNQNSDQNSDQNQQQNQSGEQGESGKQQEDQSNSNGQNQQQNEQNPESGQDDSPQQTNADSQSQNDSQRDDKQSSQQQASQQQDSQQQGEQETNDDPNNEDGAGEEIDQALLDQLEQAEQGLEKELEEGIENGQMSAEGPPLTDEEKRSYEQWMRRVPDDPSGLLRRKFEQQARERGRNADQPGEPLW